MASADALTVYHPVRSSRSIFAAKPTFNHAAAQSQWVPFRLRHKVACTDAKSKVDAKILPSLMFAIEHQLR
jgi:hypothetical protein